MKKIDNLLQNEHVEWKKLGEVCEIKAGQLITKSMIENNQGIYPVINSGKEPLGYFNTWNTENDPIGITTRGAGVGTLTYQEGKYFRGNLNYSVTINDTNRIKTRFLYHLLLGFQEKIYKLCTYNGIPALNASELKKLEIPIPSLKSQEKIVKTL
ncbi:MAG: restriction endonuclease subunit S, partial [Erysipelotrichaceae bacterium]|nr:restriction endonuclease subunit S [Erysipelotrichaceae bacterium]